MNNSTNNLSIPKYLYLVLLWLVAIAGSQINANDPQVSVEKPNNKQQTTKEVEKELDKSKQESFKFSLFGLEFSWNQMKQDFKQQKYMNMGVSLLSCYALYDKLMKNSVVAPIITGSQALKPVGGVIKTIAQEIPKSTVLQNSMGNLNLFNGDMDATGVTAGLFKTFWKQVTGKLYTGTTTVVVNPAKVIAENKDIIAKPVQNWGQAITKFAKETLWPICKKYPKITAGVSVATVAIGGLWYYYRSNEGKVEDLKNAGHATTTNHFINNTGAGQSLTNNVLEIAGLPGSNVIANNLPYGVYTITTWAASFAALTAAKNINVNSKLLKPIFGGKKKKKTGNNENGSNNNNVDNKANKGGDDNKANKGGDNNNDDKNKANNGGDNNNDNNKVNNGDDNDEDKFYSLRDWIADTLVDPWLKKVIELSSGVLLEGIPFFGPTLAKSFNALANKNARYIVTDQIISILAALIAVILLGKYVAWKIRKQKEKEKHQAEAAVKAALEELERKKQEVFASKVNGSAILTIIEKLPLALQTHIADVLQWLGAKIQKTFPLPEKKKAKPSTFVAPKSLKTVWGRLMEK